MWRWKLNQNLATTDYWLLFFSPRRSPTGPPPLHRSHLPRVELRQAPGHHKVPQQCGVFHGRPRPRRRILPGQRHRRAPPDVGGGDWDSAWQRRLWHGVRVRGQDGAEREGEDRRSSVSVSMTLKKHRSWMTWSISNLTAEAFDLKSYNFAPF